MVTGVDVAGRDLTVGVSASTGDFESGMRRAESSARKLELAQLKLIAAQERLDNVQKSGKATAGQLANAQAGVMQAQDRVAKATTGAADKTEDAGRRTTKAFGGIGAGAVAMAGAVAGAAAGAAAGMLAMASDSVRAASDLNEQMAATSTLFGDAAGDIQEFAQSAESIGLATTEALQASASFGDMFMKLGFTSDAAAVLAEDFVRMSADFASFKNLEPGEVLQKLQSGLSGESEPLKQLGIFINEAAVKSEAFKLGLAGANDELTESQKVTARASLIVQGLGDAYGDVARTADSYANAQRRSAAATENAKAALGQGLLPLWTDVKTVTARAADGVGDLTGAVQDGSGSFIDNIPVIGNATRALGWLADQGGETAEEIDYLTDSQRILANANDYTEEEVLKAAVALEAQEAAAKADEEAVKQLKKTLEDLGRDLTEMVDPGQAWGTALDRLTQEEEARAQGAVEAHNASVDERIKATKREWDARIEAARAHDDEVEEYIGRTEAEGTARDEAVRGHQKASKSTVQALEDQRDAAIDSLGAQKKEWQDFAADVGVSVDDFLGELEKQAAAQLNFNQNLLFLSGRMSEDALNFLREAGPEAAQEFVGATAEQLAELERLVAQDTTEAGQAWAQTLIDAQPVLRQIAADLGQGVADELAIKLGKGEISVDDLIAKVAELNNAKGVPTVDTSSIEEALRKAGELSLLIQGLTPGAAPTQPGGLADFFGGQAGTSGPAFVYADRRATGGLISGPGTGTSDSVPLWGSDGEYMHRAAAVSHYGRAFMDDVNSLRFPRARGYANGGFVSAVPVSSSSVVNSGSTTSNTTVVINAPVPQPSARELVFGLRDALWRAS
jgi:hypothetical protein